MAIVYTQLIYGVVLAFFFILFLWARSKPMALFSMFGVVLMLVVMQVGATILLLACLLLIAVYWNFSKKKNAQNKLILPVLLLVACSGLVLAAPPIDPPGLVRFVQEVGHVSSQPEMRLLGTDYLPGDAGKLQAFLTVGEYPLENASCFASVLYPDMSYFLQDILMTDVNKKYFEGLYYYDFTVPNVTGVYPVMAYCFYNSTANIDNVCCLSQNNFTITDGSLADLSYVDNERLGFNGQAACNNVYCSMVINVDIPTGSDTAFLTDFRALLDIETNKAGITYTISVYNDVTTNWDFWYNLTSPVGQVALQKTLSSEHIINDSTVKIRIIGFDSDGTAKTFIDRLVLSRIYNGSYVGDLRGNNELVVSNALTNMTGTVSEDVEFITGDVVISIGLLVAAILLFFAAQFTIAGLLILLWSLFFGGNMELLVQIFLWLMGFLLMYWGIKRKKDER